MSLFSLKSQYKPAGDQPKAITEILKGLESNKRNQVLLGITGSGKTFTMANVIAKSNRPAIIMAHNKTLAAQIYSEMKELFPSNAVEYFVSYYDYYQPEAYIPRTDTYIEKDSSINEQIDLLRHSATRSLLERKDVIVVSSVSAIYGLGSPELYQKMTIWIERGKKYKHGDLSKRLVDLQYTRNDLNFTTGTFRIQGENVDIFPAHYAEKAWRLSFFGDEVESIHEFDPLTGKKLVELDKAVIFANSHFVTPKHVVDRAIKSIEIELHERLKVLKNSGKLLEMSKLRSRTEHDLETLETTGHCKGIENYSRHFTGAAPGTPPPTLFQYVPKNAILFIDESHVSVPQIRSMYNGDRARKEVLVEHGFRLPSALDNRPLQFEEWDEKRPQTVFVSATPGSFEMDLIKVQRDKVVEQIIRPTGLLDPICEIRPATSQIENLLRTIPDYIKEKQRILVTSLTKKMAENITEFLLDKNIKAQYLHSEIQTLERIEIIQSLRKGEIDVLVGINLLREGLDIPECALVAILDADKQGFLRSEVSLIQTIGRAARNSNGRVILYADVMTQAIEKAVSETHRRRELQIKHNKENNITPTTIDRSIVDLQYFSKVISNTPENVPKKFKSEAAREEYIKNLRALMVEHASNLEFEKAAEIRDQLKKIKNQV